MKKLSYVIAVLGILLPSFASAAVTFDASSTILKNGFLSGPTTATTSITVGSVNANPYLVMCGDDWQDVGGAGAITGASYNGVALTKIVSSTRSVSMEISCWGLVNPATGSHIASATLVGATDEQKYIWAVFDGVDQVNPIEATSTNTGALANATTTITTLTDQDMLFESLSLFGTAALTLHTGSTLIYKDSTNSTDGGASYKIATPAGSNNMGWTWTGANDWAEAVVALKPAAGGGGGATARRRQTMIVGGN